MKKDKILFMSQFSILLGIEAIFCFTILGSIPVGPMVATLFMIPIIITAVTLGPGAGALMGLFAGFFRLIVWTFMPPSPVVAFVFSPFYSVTEHSYKGNFGSILISVASCVLGGWIAGLVCNALSKGKNGKNITAYAVSGVVGSLINTVWVLGGIWIFFGDQYAEVVGEAFLTLLNVTILTNAIPEMVVSAILIPAVCRPLKKIIVSK